MGYVLPPNGVEFELKARTPLGHKGSVFSVKWAIEMFIQCAIGNMSVGSINSSINFTDSGHKIW